MESLAELYVRMIFSSFSVDRVCRYTMNRQPGKALTYYLKLRRPNVFQLIRENNLFTDIRDQVLLLVEFDQELVEKRRSGGEDIEGLSEAITLLVDNIHSIPVRIPSWRS